MKPRHLIITVCGELRVFARGCGCMDNNCLRGHASFCNCLFGVCLVVRTHSQLAKVLKKAFKTMLVAVGL